MSKTDPVTENPNDKMPAGKPLGPNEVAPTESNGLGDADRSSSAEDAASDDDIPVGGSSVGP